MKIWHQTLSLTAKSSSRVAASNRLVFDSGLDSFLSEAAFRMPLEIPSGGPVCFVLITSNFPYLALTSLGSAGKDLAFTVSFYLIPDIKELIYWRAPMAFILGLRIKSLTEKEEKYYETYQVSAQVPLSHPLRQENWSRCIPKHHCQQHRHRHRVQHRPQLVMNRST
jgi:hypothetical protein